MSGPTSSSPIRLRSGCSTANIGEDFTRRIAALDDETVVVFDLNTGGRIRAFTFPSFESD